MYHVITFIPKKLHKNNTKGNIRFICFLQIFWPVYELALGEQLELVLCGLGDNNTQSECLNVEQHI